MRNAKIERLSASNINSFINNYDQWYETYLLGKPLEPNIYLVGGTAVHEFLENFYAQGPKTGESIRDFATRRFKECWVEYIENNEEFVKFASEEDAPYTLSDAQKWLTAKVQVWVDETTRLEEKYGSENAYKYNSPVYNEEEFILETGGVSVKGFIDAVFKHDKWKKQRGLEYTLVDYKTSSKQFGTIPAEYYIQLLIYALYYKQKRRKCQWVVVDYIKYNSKYFFRVTDDELDKLQLMIQDVWEEIQEVVEKYNRGEDVSEYKPRSKYWW